MHPTRLVAVYVRQRTNNRDPLKRWTYCLFLYVTNLKCSGRYIVKKYAKRWIIDCDVQRYLVEYRMSLNNSYLALRCLNEARWTCITGNGDVRSSVDNVPTEVIANFMWASQYTQEKLSVNS